MTEPRAAGPDGVADPTGRAGGVAVADTPARRRARRRLLGAGVLSSLVLGLGLSLGLGLGLALPQPAHAADFIVALVDSEPITNGDVQARLARVQPPRGASLPPREQLARQVLEQLINERVQLRLAADTGLKVDEATLAQAEQNVARQNRVSVEALRERLAAIGLDAKRFREGLRDEILLQRLREREVDARVRVSEQDIDAFLRERQAVSDPAQIELHLAQLLVAVPESAQGATVDNLRTRAEQLAARARAGEDFAALARQQSDGPERAAGGQMGLRSADRYPALFTEATLALKVGEVAGPLRSPAGFHILKVLERRVTGLPDATVVQTRARHILLRPSGSLSEAEAVSRLAGLRQQIASGQVAFEDAARSQSQDSSASAGGDLGWASPGQFVPEFEQAMDALAPGQVSEPLVSRFGVHLLQVLERRRAEVGVREQREAVRARLREQKAEEAYEVWVRDLRARAFVEYREPPQ